MDYPIKSLHNEVSKVFFHLEGIDFERASENGFINKAFELDTTGGITETAYILNNTVHIS